MRVLWGHGEATVSDVHETLEPKRGLALATIATMLTKMEKKGVVDHRAEGRRFIVGRALAHFSLDTAVEPSAGKRLNKIEEK